MTIRIPHTAVSRREHTYAIMLKRVHVDRRIPAAFEGPILKPGSKVESDTLPDPALLLEFAGSDRTGRGHNRSNQVHVLWRFDRGLSTWKEIARTLSTGAEWIDHMARIAVAEIGSPAPDPDLARTVSSRVLAGVDADLAGLSAIDKVIALNLLYEQLACRLLRCESGD